MGFAIFMVVMVGFLLLDIYVFMITPFEFRQGKWWRFLPGGGFAVLIQYKLEEWRKKD